MSSHEIPEGARMAFPPGTDEHPFEHLDREYPGWERERPDIVKAMRDYGAVIMPASPTPPDTGVEWAVLAWNGDIGSVGHELIAGPFPTREEAELWLPAHQAQRDRWQREIHPMQRHDAGPLYIGWRNVPQWHRAEPDAAA